jgi:hypothetical protein
LAFGLTVEEFILEFNGEFREFCEGLQMYVIRGDSQEKGCFTTKCHTAQASIQGTKDKFDFFLWSDGSHIPLA